MACLCIFFLTLLPSSLLLLLPFATAVTPRADTQSLCPLPSAQAASTFKVLVPNRTDFREFVDCSDVSNVRGFSIDVFKSAMSILLPETPCWNVTYACFPLHADQRESNVPTYNDMVDCLSEGYFDAVVGDVTIASHRLDNASFTQPYSDSGMVMLAPMVGRVNRFPGVFFAPFTFPTWCTICVSGLVTGFVLWLLEGSVQPEFREFNAPKQKLLNALWFVAALLVFFKRENITNPLAKAVLVGWITFILVLGSAYIAALSAILTVRNLGPENWTISSLVNEKTYGIGYHSGSVAHDYLSKTLGIPDERLLILNSTEDFVDALSKGPYIKNNGVAVIVEEVPYVNLFLSGLPADKCNYVIVGTKLTSAGLGLAFSNASGNLSIQFSMAILNLSVNGDLQKLQTGVKISDYQCPDQVQSTRLDLISSQGLFLFLGMALLLCILMFFAKLTTQRIQISTSTRNRPPDESDIDAGHVTDFEESIYGGDRSESERGVVLISIASEPFVSTQSASLYSWT